ncbi:MAPK regulated corepressor interacting protein 2 [Pelodytes ibericus]
MYTITRGPSKLTTQRRTAPKQQIDTKVQELKSKLLIPTLPSSWEPLPSNPVPKLVFNRVNGKRIQTPVPSPEEEVYTPAHEENVRFVYEAWQEVQQKLEKSEQNECAPLQYQDQTPDSSNKNFIPIDLDEWWGNRFLATINN